MKFRIPGSAWGAGVIQSALMLLLAGHVSAQTPVTSSGSSEKPLLLSKTVTETEINLPTHPFVFEGVPRGNMAQYFNGRTAGTRSMEVGQFQLAPGSEPHPVHAHDDDEILIVAAGEGEIQCAGKTTAVTAGSVMYAAPHMTHGIKNTGSTPLIFYFIKWVELPHTGAERPSDELTIQPMPANATREGGHVLSVAGDQLLLDDRPVKLLGLRTAGALMSEQTTEDLLAQLDHYQEHGLNTVSVYLMGSRFSDTKGYLPDASLDPVYADRLARILTAADRRGMIVLVGCLYWSESEAKADLAHWTQREANLAVANTVRWLKDKNFRNVLVDPDNEGMAFQEKGWNIAQMIDAAHLANPACLVAYNARPPPPLNADLTIHHAPQVAGKPYVETEGTPQVVPYWHEYSRKKDYRNYLNIGLYTAAMKEETFSDTREKMTHANGYLLASTWLQALPPFGPNLRVGGDGSPERPGIGWWLDFVQNEYKSSP